MLVAVGLPPVVANVSNTVGLVPGGAGGLLGFREEVREHPRLTWLVVLLTGAAGAAGALLLLALPPGVFEAIVPWLILGTCVLVAVQPRLSGWLVTRRARVGEPPQPRLRLSPPALVGVAAAGVYGGYFGAGAGVMMLAVLGLALDVELRVAAGIRTAGLLASNLVAAAVFAVVADVAWAVVALLAVSSIVGGYVGARIARRLPAALLRTLVACAGVVASATLLLG